MADLVIISHSISRKMWLALMRTIVCNFIFIFLPFYLFLSPRPATCKGQFDWTRIKIILMDDQFFKVFQLIESLIQIDLHTLCLKLKNRLIWMGIELQLALIHGQFSSRSIVIFFLRTRRVHPWDSSPLPLCFLSYHEQHPPIILLTRYLLVSSCNSTYGSFVIFLRIIYIEFQPSMSFPQENQLLN